MNEKYKKEIEAYVDGEMSKEQEKRYKETLEVFPALNDYYKKIQRQKALLKKWWNQQNHH